MYHISDLKKFSKCPRFYYLDVDNKNSFAPYLRSDESYVDLLKQKLKIEDCFTGSIGDNGNVFFDNKDQYDWFVMTRFELNNLRIKIPFLHKKNNNEYDVYFLYYGSQLKSLDIFSYRINIEVLSKLGIIVDEVYLAYINPDYVFHEKIDSDKLFIITNRYNNGRIIKILLDNVVDYDDIIHKIDSSSLDDCPPVKTRACHLKETCPYYDTCFMEEKELANDSILTLVSSQYKAEMYDEGINLLKDVDINRLEGNRVQYAQIVASRNGGLFVDKNNLKMWLADLPKGPNSYVDFEWDRYLIPPYENMKSLDVIPFEYALYIDYGDNKLDHKTFISNGDCRKEFVESLMKELPKEGPIFAYNATGAEIIRLKELQGLFPEYKDTLESIINRFVDLATPFVEGIVYDTRMAGVYSLKKLVSVVSDKSYKDLDIDDGMSAVFKWRDIDKGLDDEEEVTIDNLKKYCSLDAYGLYLVYNWLLNIVE